jgi:ribonuclease III
MASSNHSPADPDEMLDRCERIVKYRFQDRELLKRSLTHSSVSSTRLESNERLEFLGDSILGMIVSEILFDRFSECPEGEMTRIKSSVVSRSHCAELSSRLGLEECLFLGKGLVTHTEIPQSVIAGCFEAIIAAIYLDGGMEPTRRFLTEMLIHEIERLAEDETHENHKSLLQQISQKEFQATPRYQLLDEQGPDHSKSFKVSAVIEGTSYPAAWGRTKKEAEQRAAENALEALTGRGAAVEDSSGE